jgi:hypothetical protein
MPSRLCKVTFFTDKEYFWVAHYIGHERIFSPRCVFHSDAENTFGLISRANCACAVWSASITEPKSTDPTIQTSISLPIVSAARATEPNIKAVTI